MKKNQIIVSLLIFSSVAVIARVTYAKIKSEAKLKKLLQGSPRVDRIHDPKTEASLKSKSWKLYRLWVDSQKQEVSSEISQFLADGDVNLSTNAVCMLGRLENPIAKITLGNVTARVKKGETNNDGVNPIVLKMAISRIESHQKRGMGKLNAVLQSVDLNWNETIELSKRNRNPRIHDDSSDANIIMNEVVSLLYSMAQNGENVQSYADQLSLLPAQKILLQGGALKPDEEATIIVDYLSNLKAVTTFDMELAESYLIRIRPQANEAVIQRLTQMISGVNKNYGARPIELFRVAALNGDRRAISLLSFFANKAQSPIDYYAKTSLQNFGILNDEKLGSSSQAAWPTSLIPF